MKKMTSSELRARFREFFAARGIEPADTPSEDSGEPLIDTLRSVPDVPAAEGNDADPGRIGLREQHGRAEQSNERCVPH